VAQVAQKGCVFASCSCCAFLRFLCIQINKNQKRYAVTSALAASALPSLVLARGHRIEQIAEVPLVIADSVINAVSRTKDAVKLLKVALLLCLFFLFFV
jgi:ribosomal protein L4